MESRISKEVQRRVFDLTLALYRVSDFFPEGEVLRRQIREKANQIFGEVTEYGGFSAESSRPVVSILGRIESLRGYLELARSLSFVKPINLAVLAREYDILAGFFSQELDASQNDFSTPKDETRIFNPESQKEVIFKMPSALSSDFNERQRAVIQHLEQAGQAKISDFYIFFNNISTKTIQRDLQDLVARNILRKQGEKRWTVYALIRPMGQIGPINT